MEEALAPRAAPPASEAENPIRVVWTLAWPAVALNSLQVVNNILDRGFTGRLDAPAITGLSASMNVTFFMFTIIMSLAMAPTALVSRAFGAGDHDEMREAVSQSLSVALAVGVLLWAATTLVAPFASHIMISDADPAAIAYMARFLAIYAFALPALSLINNLAAALRGIGDTKSPMVISGIQILLHITLNFLLIFPTRTVCGLTIPGANMGLMGAATALATSAWCSAIAYLSFSGRTPLGPCWRFVWPKAAWVARITRIAAPAAVGGILRVLSMAAFTVILKYTPSSSAAIAAMAPGFAIESIMFMPSFGLSIAAAALVGQSLGMKRPDRAERLGWIAAHHAALVTLVFAIPLLIFAQPIASLVTPGKEAIIAESANLIRWVCATEVAFAYFGVTTGAMQGAGDTIRPLWITVGTMWFLRVPLAVALALHTIRVHFQIPVLHLAVDSGPLVIGLGMGAVGAWIAMSASQLAQGTLGLLLFKQGRWKLKKV